MTEPQKSTLVKNNRLKLSILHTISHYSSVIFMSFISIMSVYIYLNESVNNAKTVELAIIIVCIALTLLLYRLQVNRLRFTEASIVLSPDQLNNAIIKVQNELKWHPMHTDNNCIIFKTHPSFFSGSWGEQVTILFDENRILINSICDPDKPSSIVSFGRNKRNTRRLVEEIRSFQASLLNSD